MRLDEIRKPGFQGAGTYEMMFSDGDIARSHFDSIEDAMSHGTVNGAISMVRVNNNGKPMGKSYSLN